MSVIDPSGVDGLRDQNGRLPETDRFTGGRIGYITYGFDYVCHECANKHPLWTEKNMPNDADQENKIIGYASWCDSRDQPEVCAKCGVEISFKRR